MNSQKLTKPQMDLLEEIRDYPEGAYIRPYTAGWRSANLLVAKGYAKTDTSHEWFTATEK